MKLLDRPPHEITVYPAVDVDDGYGGTMPGEGAPITTRALVLPGEASDASGTVVGYPDTDDYRVIARSLPGGTWSRVVWDGADWTVVSSPRRYTPSPRTTHDVATIRRR